MHELCLEFESSFESLGKKVILFLKKNLFSLLGTDLPFAPQMLAAAKSGHGWSQEVSASFVGGRDSNIFQLLATVRQCLDQKWSGQDLPGSPSWVQCPTWCSNAAPNDAISPRRFRHYARLVTG